MKRAHVISRRAALLTPVPHPLAARAELAGCFVRGVHRRVRTCAEGGASRLRIEARHQLAGRVDAAHAQQLIARGDLDENRQIAAGRNRHLDQRHLQPDQVVGGVVEPEAVVFAALIPALELHDELDPFRRSRRGHAKQIADVDQPEPAYFHVVARNLRARADDDRFGAAPHLHGVVGDEAMTADHEVERAFALADTALADDQHAETENVNEDAVNDFAVRETILEQRGQLADCRCGGHRRPQDRHVGAVTFDHELQRNLGAAGHEQARQLGVETLRERLLPRRGIQALEEAHFALAEQQDAAGLQIFVEAGQRETGLLDVRAGDVTLEAVGAREQIDRQAYRLGSCIEQPANGHGRRHKLALSGP